MAGLIDLVADGVMIGVGGTAIKRITTYSPSLTPSSVAAATVAAQAFTVNGIKSGDVIFVTGPAVTNSSYMISARVSADNQINLIFCNPTAGALTPASGTYKIVAIEF